MTTAILLDDEQSALNLLGNYLEDFKELKVIGAYRTIPEAETSILRSKPDLLFLDIRIHGEYVFPMIERLKQKHLSFAIVFVTGFYKEHLNDVIQSCQFRYHFSYLGKPVDAELLEEKLYDYHVFVTKNEPVEIDRDYLVVKFKSVYEKIRFEDIVYCESDGNYANIYYLKDGKLCRRNQNISLSGLNEKLPSARFFRFSGKHLINRAWFVGVAVDGNNHVCQINHPALSDSVGLPIPEKKWSEFKEEML